MPTAAPEPAQWIDDAGNLEPSSLEQHFEQRRLELIREAEQTWAGLVEHCLAGGERDLSPDQVGEAAARLAIPNAFAAIAADVNAVRAARQAAAAARAEKEQRRQLIQKVGGKKCEDVLAALAVLHAKAAELESLRRQLQATPYRALAEAKAAAELAPHLRHLVNQES